MLLSNYISGVCLVFVSLIPETRVIKGGRFVLEQLVFN